MANIPYDWQFITASLNRRAARKQLKPGELSECVGVDPRYVGGLRKFAGFSRLIMEDTSTGGTTNYYMPFTGIVDAWYVEIQKGSTDYVLRGFLVLWNNSGTYTLSYWYYDEEDESWPSAAFSVLASGLTANSVIDVSGPASRKYIAIEGLDPKVLYHNGTTLLAETMGPGSAFDTANDDGLKAPTDDTQASGGYLEAEGIYGVAYRYYNSDRGVYSDISERLEYTVTGSTDNQKLSLTNPDTDPDRAYQAGYDQLIIYRTLSADIGGDQYIAGLLFKETTYDLDTDTGTTGNGCWPATVEVGIENDDILVFRDVYDPSRDSTGAPPQGGVIAYYEEANFMGTNSSDGGADTQLKWSQLHRYNPEVFPVTRHSYEWDSKNGHVISMVSAGDSLYVFTENAAFRVSKAGSQIAISRMHYGRSITGKYAAAEMGRDILAVTPLGVTIFDGSTGAVNSYGAFDRIIFDDWVSSLSNIQVALDAKTGTSYILNTTEDEALLISHVTGGASVLEDMDFVKVVTGPHPEDGGQSRAFFITANGVIVYPDDTASGTYTNLGIDSGLTLNGTVTSATSNTLTDTTTGKGWTTAKLKDAYVYIYDAGTEYAAPQKLKVSSVSGDTITFTGTFDTGETPSAGARYTISPVPFRVRGHPMPPPEKDSRMFGRRISSTAAVYSVSHEGATGNNNAYWNVGMCRQFEDTPSNTIQLVSMDEDPTNQVASLNEHAIDLEPWVEHIAAGTRFELLSVRIRGTMTNSTRISRS